MMARLAFLAFLAATVDVIGAAAVSAGGGITLRVYDNTGLAGRPVSTSVLPTTAFELPAGSHGGAWSASLTGMLEFPAAGGLYNFSCSFLRTTLGFVWVDGHRVCNDGNACELAQEPFMSCNNTTG